MKKFVDVRYSLQEFIERLVKESGYTAPNLAKMLGISKRTLYNWLDGKTARIDVDFFTEKTEFLDKTFGIRISRISNSDISLYEEVDAPDPLEDYLEETKEESTVIPVKGNFYPIVSSINAGDPGHIFVKENYEGYTHVDYPSKKNCYLLRVIGTSMECDGPRCIREGELVFVDMNLEVLNGDVVAVRLASGRQMVKQIMFESRDKDADVTLHSFNPQQPDIIIKAYDILSMNRVVMVIPKPRWI